MIVSRSIDHCHGLFIAYRSQIVRIATGNGPTVDPDPTSLPTVCFRAQYCDQFPTHSLIQAETPTIVKRNDWMLLVPSGELVTEFLLTAVGTGRVVPLNPRALIELERWATRVPDRQPNHYIFPAEQIGQGGSYARNPNQPIGSWKTAWKRTKRAAEVTVRFHDIRHTACTCMLEGGSPLSVVANVLGWSAATTAIMAKRYGHIGDTARRAAVAVLDTSAHKLDAGGHKIGHNFLSAEQPGPVTR